MALREELKKLAQPDQPQTLDELFRDSKEGLMADRVVSQINALLPQMRERLFKELLTPLTDEVKRQIGGIRVRDGRDGKDGASGKTPTAQEILSIVKPLIPEVKEEVEIEKVKGLRKILNDFSNRITSIASRRERRVGGGGGSTVIVEDLTSQANGSTKTFTTTKRIGMALMVWGTQFPVILRPVVDFTGSGNTLTLDPSIPAPESGQTLVFMFLEG